MSNVAFARGKKQTYLEKFLKNEMDPNCVFFAMDSQEIFMNGESFGRYNANNNFHNLVKIENVSDTPNCLTRPKRELVKIQM